MIIDTHAHTVPGTMLDALNSERRLFPSVRLHGDGAMPRMEFAGQGAGRPIQPRLRDLAQRRDWLAKARVDHQLVGGWTDVYGYELPGAEGADWARFYNEHMRQDAAGRAICGISSGGTCAFTAAWQRPDLFSKVLSHVGSFTNIHGGDVYPGLIRKTPPKPIRVFLQDGANDLDNEHGNWPLANQQMALALKFAKCDYKLEYGTGGHNGKHGGAILPESLRWLWRDGK